MTDAERIVFVERQRALGIAETCGLGVIEETAELKGYQTYIVEQWVCDRTKTPNTIKVYTGDLSHTIKVCVIEIPIERLRDPQAEMRHLVGTDWPAKYKETPLGSIIVIDPSELPGEMDMVLVPEGDYDKWVNRAYVNINLRRCNCTGRSALNFSNPNAASEGKFYSFYKISDAVEFEEAVINLVKVAQTALYLFNLLPKDCIDGLICDQTNTAFLEFYKHYKPHRSPEYQLKEAWMEPHLLTALITKLVVCRNKLEAYNFTKIKDPFVHYEKFQFDIEKYQTSSGLRRTRTIDIDTLTKLNECTIDKTRVRKVIRSKLDDISGINHNSPLFTEASDPEVFRHHATMKSLRSIWRPKIKSSPGRDVDQNELMHVLKSVSERTTKTGAAAQAILSKVTGARQQTQTKQHRNKAYRIKSSPVGSPIMTYPIQPHASAQTVGPHVAHDDDAILSPRLGNRASSSRDHETYSSADDDLLDRGISPDTDIRSWHQSPDNLVDQERRSSDSPALLQHHLDEHTKGPQTKEGGGDFIHSQRPHRIPKRTRPVSTSVVPLLEHSSPLAPETLRRRSHSLTVLHSDGYADLDELHRMQLPEIHMDVRSYMQYENLCSQYAALEKIYMNFEKKVSEYEAMSAHLRMTLAHRTEAFEQARHRAQDFMDEQRKMEERLRVVEDKSAKLQYKLIAVNEKLKDAEDNVTSFYGKVGSLESKMDASQRSTVALIVKEFVLESVAKVKQRLGLKDTRSTLQDVSVDADTCRESDEKSSP